MRKPYELIDHFLLKNKYPFLSEMSSTFFCEDYELFGDDYADITKNMINNFRDDIKQPALEELHQLLSHTEEEIEKISDKMLSIDPTVREPDDEWGHFPTYRAFWEGILQAFQNDQNTRNKP